MTLDALLIVAAIVCLVVLLLNKAPRVNWLAVAGILFLLTFLTGCAFQPPPASPGHPVVQIRVNGTPRMVTNGSVIRIGGIDAAAHWYLTHPRDCRPDDDWRDRPDDIPDTSQKLDENGMPNFGPKR
jgi:hypothetical protein